MAARIPKPGTIWSSTLGSVRTTTGEILTVARLQLTEEQPERQILDEANAAYSELRRDEDRWREELVEWRLWETTSGDGLEPEPLSRRRPRSGRAPRSGP